MCKSLKSHEDYSVIFFLSVLFHKKEHSSKRQRKPGGFKLSSGSLNSQSDCVLHSPHCSALPAPASQPSGVTELRNEASDDKEVKGHRLQRMVQLSLWRPRH
eukprot:superscaffoldBa00006317_g21391